MSGSERKARHVSGDTQSRRSEPASEKISLAFDELAESYDQEFTERSEIRHLRSTVWNEITTHLSQGSRILDLGCGTGEDLAFLARQGYHLTGIDVSTKMLQVAERKLRRYGDQIRLERRHHLDIADSFQGVTFDGILSNFGALNTISDLDPIRVLADRCLHSGGYLFICLINRFYLRELLRGEFRRIRGSSSEVRCGSQQVEVYYHPPKALAWPGYRLLCIKALSVLFRNDVWACWPLNRLGDHFLVTLVKE